MITKTALHTCLAALSLFATGPIINSQGAESSGDTGKRLIFNKIGFERYRDGRFVPERREMWQSLWCFEEPTGPRCSVTVVRLEGCEMHYPVVFEEEKESSNGSLTITELNWKAGRLGLVLKFQDYTSACAIDFTLRPKRFAAVRFARCSYTEKVGDKEIKWENRVARRSYEWQPPCGYWLTGLDNKHPKPYPIP
jgi:hypothetical protein